MALIQSYAETNVDTDWPQKVLDPTAGVEGSRGGLAFATPASPAYTLTSIKLYLKKVGSPTGTARIVLRAATGTIESAVPTGAELAGVDFDISTLTTSYALYEFTFSTPYLSAVSTTYTCYLRNPTSGTIDASNYPVLGIKNAGGNGINQIRNETSGDNWVANSRSPAYYLYGTSGTNWTKVLADTITLTDTIKNSPGKVLADTITLTDTISNKAGKVLADTITLSDAIIKGVGKVLGDTITLSDAITTKAVGKVLADTVTLSDAVSHYWQAFRTFTDTITLSDSITKAVTKPLTDIITLSDNITKTVGKVLTDTITLSDTIKKSFGKVLTDTITLSDSITKTIGKVLSDTISLTDSLVKLLNKVSAGIPELMSDAFRAIRTGKPFGGIHIKDEPTGFIKTKDKPTGV